MQMPSIAQQLVAPLATFEAVDMDLLNACLLGWGHRMGPLRRPFRSGPFHALMHHGRPVAVCAAAPLIRRECCGLSRHEAVELARVCAARPDLCRVAVRMWRELVLPALPQAWAVSYQDAVEHSGNLYRFDGWVRLGISRSGTDQRSGRKGRSKVIWGWHPDPTVRQLAAAPSRADKVTG